MKKIIFTVSITVNIVLLALIIFAGTSHGFLRGFTEYRIKTATTPPIPRDYGRLAAVDGSLMFFEDANGNIRIIKIISDDLLNDEVVKFPRE